MFASVGRGGAVSGGRSGVSIRLLLAFVVVAVGVVALERWWVGPPPIPPVSVQMMPEEAEAAAEEVEALGGLMPLEEEEVP
jgi:hypothetical protein